MSFPAANLDYVRVMIKVLSELYNWVRSAACFLAYQQIFVLTGQAGWGKTHGACDIAHSRFGDGLLTCIAFGHTFRGEPDPWTRILESFGLPLTLGMNGLLDALDSAAEASGSPLLIIIDAINETRPLSYWRDRLIPVVEEIKRRLHLGLCITCRGSFVPYCLPQSHGLPIIEHRGFKGVERIACVNYFEHYNLRPPISPILQPELSNPLYLKLLCETLRARGLGYLPSGWHGLAPTIRAFLDEKERQFAVEHGTSTGADIIGGSLRSIAGAIADSADSSLSWSQAQSVVFQAKPQATGLRVIEWLIGADLLIEDAPIADNSLGDESSVRPAFERLGDFLIAAELLVRTSSPNLDSVFQPGGLLHRFVGSCEAVEQNKGVLAALSILIPEQSFGPGTSKSGK